MSVTGKRTGGQRKEGGEQCGEVITCSNNVRLGFDYYLVRCNNRTQTSCKCGYMIDEEKRHRQHVICHHCCVTQHCTATPSAKRSIHMLVMSIQSDEKAAKEVAVEKHGMLLGPYTIHQRRWKTPWLTPFSMRKKKKM